MVSLGGIAGNRDHVEAHGAHAGHGLQLLRWTAPPSSAARIMPASQTRGMKAPDRPPTEDDAMTPPFFTASFSMASAAVVPGPPH